MGEKNEISVISCSVRSDVDKNGDDIWVFHKTLVKIKGVVTRDKGKRSELPIPIEWTCDLDGVPVCDALTPFGQSIRISMAVIRDLPDFQEVAERVNGSTIHFNDLDNFTGKTGERMPALAAFLVRTGKFTREQAMDIWNTPAKKAKAEAWIADLESPKFD